jgi:hypothetical protein
LEVDVVKWDLGIQGISLLLLMAVTFGLVVEVIWGRAHWHWLWPAATVAGFVIAVLVSEAWFGWATAEDLQPNIDGVSYDETLLGLMLTALAVLTVRLVTRRTRTAWISGHLGRKGGTSIRPSR